MKKKPHQKHARRHRPRVRGQLRSPHSFGIHYFQDCPSTVPAVIHEEHYFVEQPVVYQTSEWNDGSVAVPPEPIPTVEELPGNSYGVPSTQPEIHCEPSVAEQEWTDPWHARFGIQYGIDTDDLSHFGFKLLANRHGGIGVDADARILRESGVSFRDHLWLGDFNIVYELFPSASVRPRAGIGVTWLADRIGGEAGLNLTIGTDVKITRNVFFATEADFGSLGDADFFHAQATLGILQNESVEWYVGYDHLDIGGVRIKSGIAGLRFHF